MGLIAHGIQAAGLRSVAVATKKRVVSFKQRMWVKEPQAEMDFSNLTAQTKKQQCAC